MKKITEKQLKESVDKLTEKIILAEDANSIGQSIGQGVGQFAGGAAFVPRAAYDATQWLGQQAGNAWDSAKQGVSNFAKGVGQGAQQAWAATDPANLVGGGTSAGMPAANQPIKKAPTHQVAPDPKVQALQQKLIAAGAKITADGRMGPKTQAAMQQFPQVVGGAAPAAGTPLPNGTLSSGDAEIDKRMSDNAAYFKMTPDQRKAADAEAAKKLSQSNPSMTQQLTNYLGKGNPNMNQQNESKTFTNTVDELKYYSQILSEAPFTPGMVKTAANAIGKNFPKFKDTLSGIKAGLQGKKYTPQPIDPATGKFGSIPPETKNAFNITKASAPSIGAGVGAAGAGAALSHSDGSPEYSSGVEIPQGAEAEQLAKSAQLRADSAAKKLNDLIDQNTMMPVKNRSNLPDPKVKEAQRILIQFGYLSKGSDDGIMGQHTREAQKQFKTAYNSSPQPVNPMQEHVSFGEMDSLARIIQLSRR